jgi:cytochrome c oxidase cbb3-type subunit 4
MDLNILRSIITVLLFVAFIGLWVWAWSKNRKEDFEEAANIPFLDDHDLSHQSLNRGAK